MAWSMASGEKDGWMDGWTQAIQGPIILHLLLLLRESEVVAQAAEYYLGIIKHRNDIAVALFWLTTY